MIVVPINNFDKSESMLVVVIEKNNLERMKQADPITIESLARGGKILPRIAFPHNFSLLIAYEEDDVKLYELARANDAIGLLKWVERGHRLDPETDGPKNLVSYGAKP